MTVTQTSVDGPKAAPTLWRAACGTVPSWLLGWSHSARELVNDPAAAALRCPVFELHDLYGEGRSQLV
jgi:hypothetical protein